MARRIRHIGVSVGLRAAFLLAPWLCLAAGYTPLSLGDLGSRDPSREFAGSRVGETVAVRGVVNGPAFHFPDYTLLAIEDGHDGAVLQVEGDDRRLDAF